MTARRSVVCWAPAMVMAAVALAVAGAGVLQGAEKVAPAGDVDPAGEYDCRGENPGGGTYVGKVVITKTGATYRVDWVIGENQHNVGTGIREGNVLSVCWAAAEAVGVIAYKIENIGGDLRLVGRWAVFGEENTRTETLTRRGAKGRNVAGKPQGRDVS